MVFFILQTFKFKCIFAELIFQNSKKSPLHLDLKTFNKCILQSSQYFKIKKPSSASNASNLRIFELSGVCSKISSKNNLNFYFLGPEYQFRRNKTIHGTSDCYHFRPKSLDKRLLRLRECCCWRSACVQKWLESKHADLLQFPISSD